MNARTIPDLADAEPLTYYHVLCFQDFPLCQDQVRHQGQSLLVELEG